MSAKAAVKEALDQMAEESTYEEIRHRIYVMHAVDRGLAAIEAGDVIPQEEAKRRFEEWRKSRGMAPR